MPYEKDYQKYRPNDASIWPDGMFCHRILGWWCHTLWKLSRGNITPENCKLYQKNHQKRIFRVWRSLYGGRSGNREGSSKTFSSGIRHWFWQLPATFLGKISISYPFAAKQFYPATGPKKHFLSLRQGRWILWTLSWQDHDLLLCVFFKAGRFSGTGTTE